eukprot:COSAG02_NODE_3746_length_6295_cov_35.811653_3_plen_53_part_01
MASTVMPVQLDVKFRCKAVNRVTVRAPTGSAIVTMTTGRSIVKGTRSVPIRSL